MMQPRFQRYRRSAGFSLLGAAMAAGVLSMLVASYLAWVTNEYILAQRSHRWTEALHLCEAGIELALGEFNGVYRSDPAGAFTTARGWTTPSANQHSRIVSNFTDATGRTVGHFQIDVANANALNPVLTATGTVTARGSSAAITRRLVVTTRRSSSFRYAFVARRYLELRSNSSITVDSFHSTNTTMSTNGQYDPLKRGAMGNIACLASTANSIVLQNCAAHGAANTGPGGQVQFLSGASIGATFVAAQRSTSQAAAEAAGWVAHDFNMEMPYVALPPDLATAPSLGNVSGGLSFAGGDWQIGNLGNNGGNITISGPTRFYVTGEVKLSGQNYIEIVGNGSLEVYVAGPVSISGRGIQNIGGRAERNTWWGLSTSTAWSMSGNIDFIGTGYAPMATITLGGSADYMGAFVGDQIFVSGSAKIHYDEALGTGMKVLAYRPTSWQPMVNRNGTWAMETN